MSDMAFTGVLINPDQAERIIAARLAPWCRERWNEGHERLLLTVVPEEDAKTVQQDKFYHGVILRQISEQAVIGGERYAPDAWHELFKRQFLPRQKKLVRVAGRPRPVVTTTIGSTKGIGVRKMSKFIEEVIAFAQTDLGVRFSSTRWEDYR